MSKQKIILVIIILVLVAGNIFLAVKYFAAQKELKQTQAVLATQKINEKVLEFSRLFIVNVLKQKGEVDFKTRLKLENAVRNLGDEEILNQWNKFVESKTEVEAQREVKDLLEMLVNKAAH